MPARRRRRRTTLLMSRMKGCTWIASRFFRAQHKGADLIFAAAATKDTGTHKFRGSSSFCAAAGFLSYVAIHRAHASSAGNGAFPPPPPPRHCPTRNKCLGKSEAGCASNAAPEPRLPFALCCTFLYIGLFSSVTVCVGRRNCELKAPMTAVIHDEVGEHERCIFGWF